jgi:hypothetical protein
MGRTTDYQTVEDALWKAISSNNEPFVVSSLDELNDASEICEAAKKQLINIKQMNAAITINARYHQGRALNGRLGSHRSICKQLGISDHERRIAANTYKLFKGHEELMANFFAKDDCFRNLTGPQVNTLRSIIEDPVNDAIQELLDFTGVDFRSEVEPTPAADQDVVPSSEYSRLPDLV